MIEHLDRIQKLGFTIEILWNQGISISLEAMDMNSTTNPFGVKILFCNFTERPELSFEEMIEISCDYFYLWYNKNLSKLKDFENLDTDENYQRLCDSILGDITKRVYRDLSIDQIFD
jgi:hypothetical protein